MRPSSHNATPQIRSSNRSPIIGVVYPLNIGLSSVVAVSNVTHLKRKLNAQHALKHEGDVARDCRFADCPCADDVTMNRSHFNDPMN
jgi:hypothetical protein